MLHSICSILHSNVQSISALAPSTSAYDEKVFVYTTLYTSFPSSPVAKYSTLHLISPSTYTLFCMTSLLVILGLASNIKTFSTSGCRSEEHTSELQSR